MLTKLFEQEVPEIYDGVVEVVSEGISRTEEGGRTVEEAREAFVRIGDVVGELRSAYHNVVCVDDGSSDDTAAEVKALRQEVARLTSVMSDGLRQSIGVQGDIAKNTAASSSAALLASVHGVTA